jgi:hypothetical protein
MLLSYKANKYVNISTMNEEIRSSSTIYDI